MLKITVLTLVTALATLAAAAEALDPAPARAAVTLQGRVADPTGALIAGARVVLESEDGHVLTETTADSSGNYRLTLEPRDSRALRERVEAPGFTAALVEGLVLADGSTRTEDIRLTAGTTDSVTVTSGATLGNGEIATVSQLGILGTLDTFSTPFSVESFTSELLRDQQAQNITDVLQNVPGLQDANGRYSEDAYLQFRGFALSPGATLINGIPYLAENRSPDLENVERIELFKGPSSLINGTGNSPAVGGTINLTTKRAGDRPLATFDGGYSSSSDFEGHLDGGRRFFSDGLVGLRAQLGGRIGGTPIDHQTDHHAGSALEVDLRTQKLRASVDATETYRGLVGERGPLYIGQATRVPEAPRLTSNVFNDATTFTKHQFYVLAHVEYDPTSHIELFGSYGHKESPETYQGPYFSSFSNDAGDTTVFNIPYQGRTRDNVGRAGGRASFSTGPVQHQLTLTGDFTRERSGYFYEFLQPFTVNIYNPVNTATVANTHLPTLRTFSDTSTSSNNSFAVADVLTTLRGCLLLIGGLRQQEIESRSLGSNARGPNNTAVFTSCSANCVYSKSGLSPSGAGLLHLTSRLSLYANYIQDLTQGPSAPTGSLNSGQIFPPTVSTQEEAGAKYEFTHAGATLAYFRITEPNAYTNPTTGVYGLFGQQRNQGVEVEFFGNVTPALRLLGGITWIDAAQQNTGISGTEGKRSQGVPALQLTEGAEWRVPGTGGPNRDSSGRANGLTLTARVTASSNQYAVSTADPNLRIPAWARLDIGGRYTLPIKYEPSLRVNLDNVTGYNYWESGLQGLSYGTPRAVRISTGLRF